MKCPHLTEDDYRERFEGNINEWQASVNTHTDECRLDVDFFEHYVPKMEKQVTLVPSMGEVVATLAETYTLVIISSTITLPIERLLEKYNLRKYFTEVMGNDVHKSKVEKIRMVFTKYSVAAQYCVFITDTLGDMREAEKSGIGALGVTWGFHTVETLQRGNPFRLVSDPADIVSAVKEYFS
ncbi:hypothetical protein A3F55_02245 [Candidatus Adlerbacteria bacterium RIFCSPHIGHO2_12_FULL_53_18]|uniref:Haloacid dehalogenase n=2 Tax=Parcubacteria group TaxID=1794811 RepID=A0A1F4XTX0_9BACT|nr:MAG: hypothetical protein A3F55_02245 [Candidatus Adlerbacteria bacterium RIFCSPHIGHO2_12_FULL_53_18]OGG51317.1 MAG: hypothetical protein A2704_01800 [Candidatus Kaiserbacteria bacterium RIFCSPHIGHO2_01_FULL_54_36b]